MLSFNEDEYFTWRSASFIHRFRSTLDFFACFYGIFPLAVTLCFCRRVFTCGFSSAATLDESRSSIIKEEKQIMSARSFGYAFINNLLVIYIYRIEIIRQIDDGYW
ncbi:uncharacterized protein [Rutidosis leptorrhynchoides]|uniref:uncharacterized protein isoform X3 n=1 Tax=Rutidosis leptorrhynchoides TaxID=125765 RepID=UPI003A99DFC5